MVDVDTSPFMAFMEKYSRQNKQSLDISFKTDFMNVAYGVSKRRKQKINHMEISWDSWGGKKEEGYNVFIRIPSCDKGDKKCFINCKVTVDSYDFDNIGDWNLDIVEKMLEYMRRENNGTIPNRVYINDYIYNNSFKSVKDLLNKFPHANVEYKYSKNSMGQLGVSEMSYFTNNNVE